jgi:LemA protein
MSTVNLFLFSIIAVLVILSLAALFAYNSFVRSRLRCHEAWSGIDVQLKRRASLVPNLVETVKGYTGHEREVLENVTHARAALQGAKGVAESAGANNMLSEALGRLFAVVEAYPDLKASGNFMELQRELSDVEEKIAYARQFYNRNVLDYNTRIRVFPQSVLAGIFDFQPEEFFEAKEAQDEVTVDFAR